MKLHHSFPAWLFGFSTRSSAVETSTSLRKLARGNLFEDHEPTKPQANGGRNRPPGLGGSGPPDVVAEPVFFEGVPSKEELHGTPGKGVQGGAKVANVLSRVEMSARVVDGVKTVRGKGGTRSRRGEIKMSGLGPDFSKARTLVFEGLGDDDGDRQKTTARNKKPLALRRINANVPLPKIWKINENGDLIGEDAQVWYGEEDEGGAGGGAAMFMANADGDVVGSIQDGTNSYTIQTEYEEERGSSYKVDRKSKTKTKQPGVKKTKYSAVKLADLKTHDDEDAADSDSGKRLLRSNLQKVGINASEVMEKSRELEDDCGDIEGFYGPWYDSDGPYYDCEWYSGSGTRCSSFGHRYSNFGFTANQACCACGGGGLLIDVLVVYSEGSEKDKLNTVNLAIYQTNLAFSMSGTNARLRLVALRKDSSYSDYGKSNEQIYNELEDPCDPALYDVFDWKYEYGADIVHYIGDNVPTGMGKVGGDHSHSRTDRAARAGDYLFAHEVGHNMGCEHDFANARDTSGTNMGFFDASTCLHTIMSYPNHCSGGKILQFSNVLNTHNGQAVGDATSQNCAGTITTRANRMSLKRKTKVHRTVELCGNSDCEGRLYRAAHTIGDWPLMPADIGDNSLTKVKIPQGLSFEYFEHPDFGGWHRTFGSLSNDVTLSMGGHNDAVSSFKVRQIPSGKVRLCRHYSSNYCSGSEKYEASVGSWTSMPPEIGDNALSYVYIPRGFKFEYFEHPNFGGWNRSFSATNNAISLSMGGHNDAVSSFIVSVL